MELHSLCVCVGGLGTTLIPPPPAYGPEFSGSDHPNCAVSEYVSHVQASWRGDYSRPLWSRGFGCRVVAQCVGQDSLPV